MGNTSFGKRKHSSDIDAMCGIDGTNIPVTFRWTRGGHEAFVCGTFSDWQLIRMAKSRDEFFVILEMPENLYQYKFLVDGHWLHDPEEPTVSNSLGTLNNVIQVNKSDFAFIDWTNPTKAALSFSFDVEDRPSSPYSQEIPVLPRELPTDEWKREKLLPSVPIQLLDTIANSEIKPPPKDTCLLPLPAFVTVNHLYARSLKENMFVFSTTSKYIDKYVTTIFYRIRDLK